MGWILTYTGKQFYPLSPRPEDIDIEDIAHALSMSCRFTGHTKRFYSVAEHCAVMAYNVVNDLNTTKVETLAVLLHDASEAYLSDIARPVKPLLTNYMAVEARLTDIINRRFGIHGAAHEMREIIKVADIRMLATEKEQLMPSTDVPWPSIDGVKPFYGGLPCWAPSKAKAEFMAAFNKLTA